MFINTVGFHLAQETEKETDVNEFVLLLSQKIADSKSLLGIKPRPL